MSNRKIMVVDNSEYVCSSFKGAFSSAGYSTIAVNKGPEAIRLALFLLPDLFILDLLLEGLDGLKILSLLRQMNHTRNMPVILTSSSPDKNKIVTALKMGISGFLTKPIEMAPAIYKVKEIFEKDAGNPVPPASTGSAGLNMEHFKNVQGNIEDLFKYLRGLFDLLIVGFANQNKDMILATLSKIEQNQGEMRIDSVTQRLGELKAAMLRNSWQESILQLEELFYLFRELNLKLFPYKS